MISSTTQHECVKYSLSKVIRTWVYQDFTQIKRKSSLKNNIQEIKERKLEREREYTIPIQPTIKDYALDNMISMQD